MEQLIIHLRELKLLGMVNCLETQDILNQDLTFEEKFDFLLHHELTHKKNKKIARLLSNSKFIWDNRLFLYSQDKMTKISERKLERLYLEDIINLFD
jgi:hypothetical protein